MLEMWHFYVKHGVVYIPIVAKTESGFFLDVEPIEVIPTTDPDRIRSTLQRVILRGNPVVPTPGRDTISQPKILDFTGDRSWSMFERTAFCWEITKRDDCYAVQMMKRRHDRGWEDDPSTTDVLPLNVSIDEVVERTTKRVIASHG